MGVIDERNRAHHQRGNIFLVQRDYRAGHYMVAMRQESATRKPVISARRVWSQPV